jgi:hypothetical protein
VNVQQVFALIDVPAMVLFAMLLIISWVLYKTQQRKDFDFGNMLRDDAINDKYPKGKESIYRLIAPGAFTIHTWYIVHEAVLHGLDKQEVYVYALIWSGSLVAVKLIDAIWPKP